MNNRKRMIAKVYRKNPELLISGDSVASVICRATEAVKTMVEAFNRIDWAALLSAIKTEWIKEFETNNTPAGE